MAAGSVDIGAEGPSDDSADAVLFENGGEAADGGAVAMAEAGFPDLVDGDKIDMDGHGAVRGSEMGVEDAGEVSGGVLAVVFAVN